MSASSINRAANDAQLQARVIAMAQREIIFNADLAATTFGRQLAAGMIQAQPLMWPVAVDNEAAYESAELAGRGAPGHDVDIITDANITASLVTHWPYAPGEGPNAEPAA